MPIAYIAFGSNLGDRNKNINDAVSLLKARPKIKVIKTSSIIETEPEGGPKQGKFLNGALKIETDLSSRELLIALQDIENKLGRKHAVQITGSREREKNGPRTIDLDIIFYGDEKINEPDLIIPHPRWNQRSFVKNPIQEICK